MMFTWAACLLAGVIIGWMIASWTLRDFEEINRLGIENEALKEDLASMSRHIRREIEKYKADVESREREGDGFRTEIENHKKAFHELHGKWLAGSASLAEQSGLVQRLQHERDELKKYCEWSAINLGRRDATIQKLQETIRVNGEAIEAKDDQHEKGAQQIADLAKEIVNRTESQDFFTARPASYLSKVQNSRRKSKN